MPDRGRIGRAAGTAVLLADGQDAVRVVDVDELDVPGVRPGDDLDRDEVAARCRDRDDLQRAAWVATLLLVAAATTTLPLAIEHVDIDVRGDDARSTSRLLSLERLVELRT